MAIDGTYNVVVNTPMGKQNNEMTLKTDGASVSGSIKSAFGTDTFSGGTVDGDGFEFKIDDDLWRRLRAYAMLEGRTTADVPDKTIAEYLKRRE